MLKRGFQFAPGYRLQEFLGRGQFGQVWRATAPGGAASAAKFIDLSDGQGQKEYDGIRRVKQIRHANLMPITAIWLLDGQGKVIEEAPDEAIETIDLSVVEPKGQSVVYRAEVEPSWLVVAMLLGGKSLQQRLRECIQEGLPGIPPKELISYMDESAKGIDYLNSPQHDLGEGPIAIQHSDIKPANIVLIGSSAVVCDFGLARILTRNQVTATSAAGTPAYMAPEAISGKPSRSSDQYSLAVTYYHLRTGALPVTDGSLWEVLDAHRQGKLKLGLVPESEQEVLRKATDLNWENRFESCVEMVDSLREALRAEGHTKPGFVPKSIVAAPAGAEADTQGVEGDPTATLDLPPTQSISGQALHPTAPNLSAEQSTQEEGFLKETLPELEERPAADGKPSETKSPIELVRSNPKWLAGIAASFIALVLAAMMWPDTNGGKPIVEIIEDVDGVDDLGADPPPVDTDALVREALALFETDEKHAIEKFTAALSADPGLANLPVRTRSGHSEGAIMRMIETPDGSSLVSLGRDPAPLFWRLGNDSDQPTKLESPERRVNALALSPSGDRLLTGGRDSQARVWNLTSSDIASGALTLDGHVGEVEAAAWYPSGKIVATVGDDTTLRIWHLDNATPENPSGVVSKSSKVSVVESLTALASDADGKWLAARSLGQDEVKQDDDDVLIYPWSELIDDVDNVPEPVRLSAKTAKLIAFLHSGEKPLLVTGDIGGSISIYSTSGGLDVRNGDAHTADVEALRVVRAGDRDVIVTGSSDGSVHWWKYGATSEQRHRLFSEMGISSVDVSADSRWVAAGDNEGSVWLWDTTSSQDDQGALRLITGSSSVDSVLIDVQSRWLIAGCDDGVIRMWDLPMAKLLALTQPTPPGGGLKGTIELPLISMR